MDIIPHGIPDVPFVDSSSFKAQFGVEGRQVLLTFGLIGPGKGIEHVIEALPEIVRRHPNVVYLVLGATHPHLLAQRGRALSPEPRAPRRGARREGARHLPQPLRVAGRPEGVHRRDGHLPDALSQRGADHLRARWPMSSARARRWSPRPTGTPRNCSPTGAACWCPSAIRRRSREAVCGLLDDPARMEKMRRDAYAMGRGMIWPAVARRYLEVVPARPGRSQGDAADRLRGVDARQPAVRPAAAAARSRRAHERRHRHLPARHLQRAELPRRLLHRRQRPRLHPLQPAGRARRPAARRAASTGWPPATSPFSRRRWIATAGASATS